jgi:hypothetical protein
MDKDDFRLLFDFRAASFYNYFVIMTERGIPRPETTEQVGGQLIEFIEKIDWGTPEYQAVSDYLHLRQLEQSLRLEQANAISNAGDPERKMHRESQIRITEQEIAFHRTQIYQHQSRVQGYDSTYVRVGIGLEHDLMSAARREAEGMFTQDREQQRDYVQGIQTKYLDKTQDMISKKRA